MSEENKPVYLWIARPEDRTTVAAILFSNGYSVQPVRRKKNSKTYEYLVKCWLGTPSEPTEDDG